jgi:DNA helicase-2/ATP-dependent DNA helicase PcrA
MFTDESNGASLSRVTLSTVHKAKGLEFPTVFILDFDKYMPSKYAKRPWQIVQETNLIYVAITRAMERLVYINSDSWKE